MDGEAGLENSVLNPAQEELAFRSRTVKSADVAALTGYAGQTHAENGGNVVFQGIPAGQVVACPGLGIPLDSAVAGTAYNIRSGIFKGLVNGFVCNVAHNIGHNGFQLSDGASLAFKIAAAVLIYHTVIFTVVIPDRAGSVIQHILLQQSLPVFAGRFSGKIYKHTLSAPPGSYARFFAGAGLDKHVFLLHFFQHGVNQKNTGFYVGGYGNTPDLHLMEEILRILKSFFIPGKYTAFYAFVRFYSTVTRGKLESVYGNALFSGCINKFCDSVITVFFQFRVVHGGTKITQGIAGEQSGFSGQIGIAFHNLADRGTGD